MKTFSKLVEEAMPIIRGLMLDEPISAEPKVRGHYWLQHATETWRWTCPGCESDLHEDKRCCPDRPLIIPRPVTP